MKVLFHDYFNEVQEVIDYSVLSQPGVLEKYLSAVRLDLWSQKDLAVHVYRKFKGNKNYRMKRLILARLYSYSELPQHTAFSFMLELGLAKGLTGDFTIMTKTTPQGIVYEV